MELILNGNENSASTRIRGMLFTNGIDADILYVQKEASEKTVEKVKVAGKKVIYDLDDKIRDKPGKRRKTMLGLANVVTTDTEFRAEEFRNYAREVHVVPDCIDYISEPVPVKEPGKIRTVVTFGNKISTAAADGWVTHYICDRQVMRGKLTPWNLKTFPDELRKFDLCVLRHNKTDSPKGNLRLITAMALGVPCVVSNTPSFSKTMIAAGYRELIADDVSELPHIIKFIEAHPEIGQRCMDYAWEHYSPEASREVFRKVIKTIA